MAIERQLSNDDIDEELGKVQFSNENYAKQFDHITQQTWFRQYGKGSKSMLRRITAKVKSGIKHDKYGETGLDTLDSGWKRYLKTKQTKKVYESEKQVSQGANMQQRSLVQNNTKLTRKEAEQIKRNYGRAPSGRELLYDEVHEGAGSKRAFAARERAGYAPNDYFDRKGNTTYVKEETI